MGRDTIKDKVFSGLTWKMGERMLTQGISFVLSIILARLLSPDEYGTVSLVLIFITIANVFVTNGFGESLIQRKNADALDFSTMFYCSLALSIVLYAIMFVSAPLISAFYNSPELVSILRVLSLMLPISAINTIQNAYVSKNMMFKKFFTSSILGTLVSGIVGIWMAYEGYGVWALVAQHMVSIIVVTIVLFVTVGWHPQFLFCFARLKQMFGFAWKLTASQLINTLYSELRQLVIGKIYTSSDLAFYNKGNQFPSLVINNIDTSISSVLYPAMATAESRERLKQMTRRSMQISSFIIFPLMVGMIAVADPMIELLLTEKWLPCVPYLQLGCIYWMFQPGQTANAQAIKATGRGDIYLKLEIVKKIIGVSLLLLTMKISVFALVASNTIFAGISMLINMYPNKKLIFYGYREQLKDLGPSLILSCSMGVVVFLTGSLSAGNWILIPQVLVGVLVYIGGAHIFKVESYRYIVAYAGGLLRKKGVRK